MDFTYNVWKQQYENPGELHFIVFFFFHSFYLVFGIYLYLFYLLLVYTFYFFETKIKIL